MIDAVIIAFIVALLRRGSMRGWANLDLRGTEWIAMGLILQYGAVYLALQGVQFFVEYGKFLFVGSFAPLLYGAWVSRALPGMKALGVGIILNFIVIAANGGSMPVDLAAAHTAGLKRAEQELLRPEYIKHSLAHEGTKFLFLADIFPLPPPYPRPGVASIGDVVSGVGLFTLVQWVMVIEPRRRQEQMQAT